MKRNKLKEEIMEEQIKKVGDLKTGMVVKLIDDEYHYVVYKNAIAVLKNEDYLVEVESKNCWSSRLVDYDSDTLLIDTSILMVWSPTYPYYTGKELLKSLTDSDIIYKKKMK